ncbi:MAG: 3'-5' exoribonuclease YhaM family protein [Candidatus Helarchaeota archaeon]
MYCNEIVTKENNCPCDGVFWVKSRSCPTYFTGGGGGWKDKTGEIRLTYFDDDKDSIHAKFESIPKNSIVKVVGKVNIWRDKVSINVGGRSGGSLELADRDECDISQFIPKSNQDPDELLRFIQNAIDEMDEGPLKDLMNKFMDDAGFIESFKTCPGAMMYHHSCKGGLLEHTWEVLSHCKITVEIHKSLKKDLVFAGAILHDIGKIRELQIAEGITQTQEGALLGHIHLTVEMVDEKIHEMGDFPIEIKNQLFHILLSHHEKLENGSPVETMTPEAIAVSCADGIGSKVSQYIRAVKDAVTDENKFRIRPIGWVYKCE